MATPLIEMRDIEKHFGRENHARCAVATLDTPFLRKPDLQRMRFFTGKALDGNNL